ncbi:MAG: MFS transporter [Sandaracinaceae bacterium]|nr:MFS transporter [Sandaracinaceae bacterium]
MALAQLLPSLQRDFELEDWHLGALVAFVNVGTVIAYVLVRQADRVGRKPLLNITIVGYAITSFLSGLVPDPLSFAVLQLLSRVFLIGEWVVSTVYAAEEFPANERGFAIGLINAFSSLGAVLCAGVVPLLLRAPWGWRTVYFVGTVPLILLALARRSIRETTRFSQLSAEERRPTAILRIFGTPYRRRVLQLALIWGLTYLCTQTAVTFFKSRAVDELHRSEGEVGTIISVAAVLSMPLVFLIGRFFDRFGRRPTATFVFLTTALGCLGAYTTTELPLLFVSAVLAVFGVSAVLPALNAFNTELFPTDLRADAFAWSNNLLGRIGYVLSPLAVGAAATHVGWGPSVAATALGPLIALVLVWRWLPETSGRELEETAKL